MRLRSTLPVIAALMFVYLAARLLFPSFMSMHSDSSRLPSGRTAVFFAFNEASPEDVASLSYFLDAAVWPSPSHSFFIIVNGETCSLKHHPKLTLPNVQFMQRPNEGYDFAAYDYALSSINPFNYAYFIFLNSGVRGPLLPKHQLPHIKAWPLIFTSLLNERVKLVGPTVSCEVQVHLQSHCFALDLQGLTIAREAGVFQPSEGGTFKDLIVHSEFGLTNAIMAKGFTIDTFMTQYTGMDWLALWNHADKGVDQCNGGKNPTVENFYGSEVGGTQYSIPPLEVVFAKRGGTVRKLCKGEVDGKRVCNYDVVVDDTCAETLKYLAAANMNE